MDLGEKKPPYGGFFIYGIDLWGFPIKIVAYIDGFNLYFGSLRGTSYRWLDIPALAKQLCHEQNSDCELVAIKYYTADIKAKLSSHGKTSLFAINIQFLVTAIHDQLFFVSQKVAECFTQRAFTCDFGELEFDPANKAFKQGDAFR